MQGETDLDRLLAAMSPRLDPGLWVFATVPPGTAAEPSAILTLHEAEGTTLILPLERAVALGLRHAFPCRMITLQVHSSLAATGFMARIAGALAARGMAVNPVSGFFHDHLFLPDGREAEAMEVLHSLSAGTRPRAGSGAANDRTA